VARRTPAPPWFTRGVAIETALGMVSAAFAAVIVAALVRRVPVTNQAHTDIVGYPIFANFNASSYPDIWYLAVIGWPLVSVLIFLLGRSLLRTAGLLERLTFALHAGRARTARVPAPVEAPIDLGSPTERIALSARLTAVALVWGFAGAIVLDDQGLRFWRDMAAVSAVYLVVLLLVVAALSARRVRLRAAWRGVRLVSAINALGAALTIGALLAVSEHTTLTTLSDNVQHPMHWLPVPLGIVLIAISAGVVGIALWRVRDAGSGRVRIIERRALFLVAVPVVIFLFTAALIGGLKAWDNFEGGQQIVTLRLLNVGEVPYRDFLPFHGLLVDTLFNALGYQLLSTSAWGAMAGAPLVIIPLTWVTLYLFAYRVMGGSWAALVTLLLLFFHHILIYVDDRLIFWPLILVLLAVAFDRRSRMASFGVGAAAAAFAVVVPEASYAVPACGLALVARDAYNASWPRPHVARDFRLTLWAIAGGAAVGAAGFSLLAAEHAVGGFIDFYVTLVPGHDLEGTIPISFAPLTGQFLYWILAPGAAALLAFVILAARVRLRLTLRTNHFLMIAAGIFTVLYYAAEFLSRADPTHAELSYGAAIPLVILCAWEAAKWLNRWVRAQLQGSRAGGLRWPLFYVAAALAGITSTTSIPTQLAATPADFRAAAATEPWLASVGYVSDGEEEMWSDVGTLLSAFLKPGQEIYDFSNQPGLYFYMLDYRPATPHFFAAFDYSQATQEETIRSLEANRPEFAILYGTAPGSLSVWDGIPNTTREYDISQYLLDHYRPFADVDGQMIYVEDNAPITIPDSLQAELGSRLTQTDIPFHYPDCAWGDVPEFLTVQPPAGATGVVVGGASGPSEAWNVSEPSEQVWADYRWIQLTVAPGSPGASFTLADREVAGEHHDVTFKTLPGGEVSYRFPIGACTQWHGYSLPTLRLSSSVPVTITRVELLP
jgi:hypothetical protein